MHPHWYSASPDVQRRLISLFIHSLAPKSQITTLSPTPSAATSAFESEISFTRSPHDVAAVLRWGLRHLQLDSANSTSSFGKDANWYKAFVAAEKSAQYPPNAFSQHLNTLLPPAHLELLTATLEILSSLAAHAEANSTSGSKLSKLFGLWLLASRRVEEKDDWAAFYARWECMGRMLEHLFLSRIRFVQFYPTRLASLMDNLSLPPAEMKLQVIGCPPGFSNLFGITLIQAKGNPSPPRLLPLLISLNYCQDPGSRPDVTKPSSCGSKRNSRPASINPSITP